MSLWSLHLLLLPLQWKPLLATESSARIDSGKHILGQVLRKQGLLLSEGIDVSRLLLKPNQGEEGF